MEKNTIFPERSAQPQTCCVRRNCINFVKHCLQHSLNYLGLLVHLANFLKKKNCVINIFVSPSYPKCIFAWRVGSKIRSQGVTRCTHLMSGENRWAWSCPRMIGSLRTDGKTKQKQSLSQNTPVRPICIYPEDITTSCLCSWMIKEVKTSSAVSQWLRCIKHNNVYMELYVYIWKNSCFRLF